MPFELIKKEIEDVLLIKPRIFEDERGYFLETFKNSDFKRFGIAFEFLQDNQSYSKSGVLRGLHYQLNPKSQGKLVRVIRGKVFDVAVDLRKGSPTFGKWVSEILSSEGQEILWIPPGFAHGFVSLEDSILCYKETNEYSREHEAGICWNDEDLCINWPISNPVLIEKDSTLPSFKEATLNFDFEK